MKRQFDEIMKSLKTTIASYDYFVDFPKVYKNVDDVVIPLNLLNSLLNTGSEFDARFVDLIHKYPESLKAIPILLAIRTDNWKVNVIDGALVTFDFKTRIESDEQYLRFMEKTGLKELISKGKVSNLIDYVTGVEVGLDSNARKNRTGTSMEHIVSDYLSSFDDIEVIEQATKHSIKTKFGFSGLEPLDLTIGKGTKRADKRFDFAVKYKNEVFLIETNFYGSGGSKLNETARSYEMLAEQINRIPGCQFIWITDGVGWKTAQNNLKESYEHQNHLLTLKDLEFDDLINLIRNYTEDKK